MPALSDDLFFASAVEINGRLRQREFSTVELARAFAERLEKIGPRYNALALSLRDDAIRQAQSVDKQLKRGRTRGVLQGVPWAVKDLLSVAGRPTTWGAKPFAGQVFDYDAAAVDRLDSAGSVLTGKLAMIELAGGGGYNSAAASLQGPCLNPWDRSRWSGGSSSGSAAAVAAGLVPFALGSETSGSIVTPCSYCGVTGLRPTYGLVSRFGAMPLSWTLDKIGPIAHTAEDCGHILQAIAGGDSRDPGSARKSFHFAPEFTRAVDSLTVGFAPADFDEHAGAALRAPLRSALEVIRGAGVKLVEVELPAFPYREVVSTVIGAEAATAFSDLLTGGLVEQLADSRQIEGLKSGLKITAYEYLQAMRVRRLIQSALHRLFEKADILLSPAQFSVAPFVRESLNNLTGPSTAGGSAGLRSLIPAANLAGLPALALPAGLAEGLPVAISLVGKPFSENTLLKMGMYFQAATNHHRLRPPTGME